MTKKIKIGAILTLAFVGITIGAPKLSDVTHETLVNQNIQETPDPRKELLASREEWLKNLIKCESGGNPLAVNEVDRDGTPSYGLLQFKPSTFETFSKAYGVVGELMDPEAQKEIVRKMMDDPSVKWEKQFPDCVTIYIGWPPGVLH